MMQKTLLAALVAASVLAACGGGGDDTAAAGDLRGAGQREPASIDGFIGYLKELVASMADMLEPVDTSAVVAARPTTPPSRRRSTEHDEGGARASLSIARDAIDCMP